MDSQLPGLCPGAGGVGGSWSFNLTGTLSLYPLSSTCTAMRTGWTTPPLSRAEKLTKASSMTGMRSSYFRTSFTWEAWMYLGGSTHEWAIFLRSPTARPRSLGASRRRCECAVVKYNGTEQKGKRNPVGGGELVNIFGGTIFFNQFFVFWLRENWGEGKKWKERGRGSLETAWALSGYRAPFVNLLFSRNCVVVSLIYK